MVRVVPNGDKASIVRELNRLITESRPNDSVVVFYAGHVQKLVELRLDCDRDTVLITVEQVGGIACHTGRAHCFFHRYVDGEWVVVEPVVKDPAEIYRK